MNTWTALYDPCAIRVATSLQRLDIAKGSYAYCTILVMVVYFFLWNRVSRLVYHARHNYY